MAEQDKRLEELWEERYHAIYSAAPGGFLERLDPHITKLDLENKRLVTEFQTKLWMSNPRHMVHGGVIASMADTAMGMMSRVLMDSKLGGPTLNLSINYIRAVPLDATVCVRAACQKQGRQLMFFSCEGYLPDAPDEVLFTAQCSYLAGRDKYPEPRAE